MNSQRAELTDLVVFDGNDFNLTGRAERTRSRLVRPLVSTNIQQRVYEQLTAFLGGVLAALVPLLKVHHNSPLKLLRLRFHLKLFYILTTWNLLLCSWLVWSTRFAELTTVYCLNNTPLSFLNKNISIIHYFHSKIK